MPASSNFEDGILNLGCQLNFLIYLHSVFNITSYRFQVYDWLAEDQQASLFLFEDYLVLFLCMFLFHRGTPVALYFAILAFYILSGATQTERIKSLYLSCTLAHGVIKLWSLTVWLQKIIFLSFKIPLTGFGIRGTLYYRLCSSKVRYWCLIP